MRIKQLYQRTQRDILFFLSEKLNYPLMAPDMLQLCFTFKCGLRCKMCNMHKKMEELKSTGKPYELSVSLMKNLILQAYRIGIKEVYFVGGEPFIEENIFNLVQCASRLGMASTVNTNGLLLNADKIDRVFDCGLSCLTFSIDGPDKETYESIRGEHIFEQVVGNLENLLSRRAEKGSLKPRITILCTVMRQNIQKLPQMVVFAKKIGVDWVQFQPVVPDNTDQSQDVFSDTWIGEENFNTLDSSINDVIRLKKGEFSSFITSSFQQLELTKLYFRNQMPRVRSCYLGLSRLIVTQDHKLYFCAQDPLTGNVSFGDVSQKPLKELWTSKEAGRFREHIKHCNRPCLLFCAYRHEFDSLWDRFKKFNVHIDRMLGKNPSNG